VQNRDIIVIGGSAGAVRPLSELLGALPGNFPAAVLAVLHFSPLNSEWLSGHVRRSVRLAVDSRREPIDIRPGQVFVARPDHHLIVMDRRAVSSRGPRDLQE
jgi:two-component system chemotaxis response regulator CheB